MERVRKLKGITFYNDSIGSSPTRTIAGLKSFDHRVILIAGGYDKKIPYDEMGEVLENKRALWIGIGFLLVGFLIMLESFNVNYPSQILEQYRVKSETLQIWQVYIKSMAVLLFGFILSSGGMFLLVNTFIKEE
jgi:UDP-N-acetylmuramoylalanine-D-glutamate ligase